MTSVGLQSLLLPLLGIQSALVYHELMGLFEIARVLGASYRFATSGSGLGALYGRFTLNFFRTIVGGIAHDALMDRSIEELVPQA
ncbi:hypothetical protein EDE08_106356 [Bradyrhizobium sp. R2.2-H]|jgi:hypothetical protein|uniref:hypothetical protein n=1 Tax=unclassified Bradyrhizobium TaxID=2631580 RepID=UPI001053C491|nr:MULTISPECIES: hypothetical protein [unclassified Bradyrhizobium]TCU71185.1 hypothetical protein EDE10_10650 [Bradyrhizobium sp. Y-H1]TCU73296.1 hypothetical protein EDE08_106356 [Bradyrhizobium sp. R2.2-H]